jgi:hypothetical protein
MLASGSRSLSARVQNRRCAVSSLASVDPDPRSRALDTSANSRKCWNMPSPNGCPRSTRWHAARWTLSVPEVRRRRPASSASALVGSLTTSVPRVVLITLCWLTGPSAEQVPSGVTGDRSIPSNSSGSSAHRRASSADTRRGSHPAARTNLSASHRSASLPGVTPAARRWLTSISRLCSSPGLSPSARACRGSSLSRTRRHARCAGSVMGWPRSRKPRPSSPCRRGGASRRLVPVGAIV